MILARSFLLQSADFDAILVNEVLHAVSVSYEAQCVLHDFREGCLKGAVRRLPALLGVEHKVEIVFFDRMS